MVTKRRISTDLEIGTGSRALDDSLNGTFDLIPIPSVDAIDGDAEIFGDFIHLTPTLLIVDETDADSDSTESTGSTDSMKIGLGIGPTVGEFGKVLIETIIFLHRLLFSPSVYCSKGGGI